MTLKDSIQTLKRKVDKQLEFIEWLKSKGLYEPMENAVTMNKMHAVWQNTLDDYYNIRLQQIGDQIKKEK